MSTILDALSRAERERQMGEIPAIERALLESTNAGAPMPAKKISLSGLLPGLGLLLCGALIAVLALTMREQAPTTLAAPQEPAAAAPQTASLATAPAAQADAAPVLKADPDVSNPPPHHGPAHDGAAVQAKPAGKPADSARVKRESPKVAKPAATSQAAASLSPPAMEAAPVSGKTQSTGASSSKALEPLPPTGKSSANSLAVASPAAKPAPVPTTAASAALPWINELPAGLRQDLPAISLGGYIYSANVAERSILINGKLLREGDQLAPGLRLEQMRPDGVVFGYKDVRFRMRY